MASGLVGKRQMIGKVAERHVRSLKSNGGKSYREKSGWKVNRTSGGPSFQMCIRFSRTGHSNFSCVLAALLADSETGDRPCKTHRESVGGVDEEPPLWKGS
jgi:hypothetical protein